MKSIRNVLAPLFILAGFIASINLLHAQDTTAPDSIVQVTAEGLGLSLVSPTDVPEAGTFWLVMSNGIVPDPAPLFDPTLPVFQIADNEFLVDATCGQVAVDPDQAAALGMGAAVSEALAEQATNILNVINQVQAAQVQTPAAGRSRMMGLDDLAGGGLTPALSFSTNSLWLQITNVANGQAYLNLMNATDYVYEVFSTPDLGATNWDICGEVFPADTNCQPFNLPLATGSPSRFIWARDWTGITSNGNETPEWWFWKYFGTVDLSDTNLDSANNTLLYDYQNGVAPPNAISFTVRLGSQYFNTANAGGSYLVLGGIPSYEAVLVNDTNVNDAVWQPYDGNIALSLGPTDGVYQVWLGLKGFATNAPPTWVGTTVNLDRSAPVITLTSPTNGTTAVPYLQLQGYSMESLQGVTYDLSNAVAVITNQPGQLLGGQFFDTNQLAYTTDYFQCYDLPLTNGLNAITVHATDLAGNVTTTNLNVTLDYSTANNPVIQLAWPQNGMQLCGGSFTVRGWVDDPTAQVTAQITDTNGDTNTVIGTVERNGNLWVENLPLAEGANGVTLRVTNAAGLSNETNFSVVKSDLTLALTSIDGDLWFSTVNVSGVISDPAYAVWVNGVQGTNYGNGTWGAANVPVSAGGVASFDLSATAGGGDPDASTNLDKPTEVVLESAHWTDVTLDDPPTRPEGMDNNYLTGDYSIASGGTVHEVARHFDTNGVLQGTGTFDWKYAPDMSFLSEHDDYGDGDTFDITSGEDALQITLALGALSDQADDGYWQEVRTSQVKDVLHLGGKSVVGDEVLVAAGVGSGTEELAATPFYLGLDYGELTVKGLGKTLGPDGLAYGTAAVGSSVSLNLTAPVPYHVFNDGAGLYTLVHQTWYPALTDTNRARLNIGVGEYVDLSGMPANTTWTGPGLLTTNSAVTFTAPSNACTATVTATVRDVSLQVAFAVKEPTGVDHAQITATNHYAIGVAGVGMQTSVWIAPTSVSFYRVNVMEVGEDASNMSGYFTQWTPQQLHHSTADHWTQLNSENQFDDEAYDFSEPSPWSAGSYMWDIPARWQIVGSGVTNSMSGWNQTISIDASGTMTVQKFSHSVTRTTNDVITTN